MLAKPQIAVQMMMLKGKVEELGIFATLEKLSEMGYRAIEVSQIDMCEENVQELERARDELGINICALSCATVPSDHGFVVEVLRDQFDKIVADAKRLESKYLRIGGLPGNCYGNYENYLKYAEELNDYGRRLSEHGLKLFYHHHHYDFEKQNSKYLFDLIVENTNPEYVGFELDVHWLHKAGVNINEWIEKLEGRVELVHLKDYRIKTPSKFEGEADFLYGGVQFAEIGEGNFDFNSIITSCERAGVRYMPIEQDDTYGKDPFESLQISMDNLKEMGYSKYF